MAMLKQFIELSRWFNRKSQHYVLGNWTAYLPWRWHFRKRLNYLKRYPGAWAKFMWLSRWDIWQPQEKVHG